MKRVAYQDDAMENGGHIIGASATLIERGKRAARVDDLVQCRLHGVQPLIEGDASMPWEGKDLVVDGCRAACGCCVRASHATIMAT